MISITISVKIDKAGLEVLNNIIIRHANNYLKTIVHTAPYFHDLYIKTADKNLADFWRKISLKLIDLNGIHPSKKRSFGINLNHWVTFSNLIIWLKPNDPYIKVIFRDIRDQIIRKTAIQPLTFGATHLA